MNTNIATRVADFLNQYLFDKVWNEPYKEYRRNIVPSLLSPRPFSCSWLSKSKTVALPTSTGNYYLYTIPKVIFNGITIESDTWINLVDYLSVTKIELRVFGIHGELLYRPLIFIRTNPVGGGLLLAIEQTMALRILDTEYDFSTIYLSVLYDSDRVNDTVITAGIPDSEYAVQQLYNTYATATLFIVNGHVVTLNSMSDLRQRSYIESVRDNNVVSQFKIDLSTTNHSLEYFSSHYNRTNTIVHIPKALNPVNTVITYNTCDFYIRPKNIPLETFRGVYLHFCLTDKITQISHNDFAIPNSTLEYFYDWFDTTELELTVQVRNYSQNNRLIRDANYIDMLYYHNDATIIQFLRGTTTPNFAFWKAETLETSKYVAMMFDVPDFITIDNMGTYIDALGYNQVLALICQRIHRLTINDALGYSFEIYTPIIFEPLDVTALVYIAGKKIAASLVTTARVGTSKIVITLDHSVIMPDGAELVVELFEKITSNCYEFTPSLSTYSIVLPFTSFDTYEIRSLHQTVYSINPETSLGTNGISNVGATLISNLNSYGSVVDNGNGTVTFSAVPYAYGKKLRFYNKRDTRLAFSTTFSIDDYEALNNKAIVSGMLRVPTNLDTQVPLLGSYNALVFLNGKTLVNNLDYRLNKHSVYANQPAFYEVVLQNMSYLQKTDNYLEIYITKDLVRDESLGFVSGTQLSYTGDSVFWFDNISQLSIDGMVVGFPYSWAGMITLSENSQRNGAPYQIRTIIPSEASVYLTEYRSDTDTARLIQLRDYFAGLHPVDNRRIVIPCSHNIYSVLLTTVANDVLAGTKLISFITDPTAMVRQIKEYLWLKAYDVVFTNTTLDLRYVDIFPIFRRNETSDRNIYRSLIHLMKCVLTSDDIKNGDSVNELK